MLSPQLFALVVGINHYRSSVVSDLGGCANDARAIYGFLTQRLGVPTENIRLLTSTGRGTRTKNSPPARTLSTAGGG